MRVVIDTNVLVRSTPVSQGGPAREVLERLLSGSHILITSEPLIAEIADVIQRPGVRRLHGMSDARIAEFIAMLESSSDAFALPTTMPALVPDDPKDAPVVATAIVGRADVLCTRDRHLRHPDVLAVCQANGIRVLSDIELLNELRSADAVDPTT
ncbi:MAG: putative toxin-antitoxin system toxin component, PIN family [Planctomycetota bacterium]